MDMEYVKSDLAEAVKYLLYSTADVIQYHELDSAIPRCWPETIRRSLMEAEWQGEKSTFDDLSVLCTRQIPHHSSQDVSSSHLYVGPPTGMDQLIVMFYLILPLLRIKVKLVT